MKSFTFIHAADLHLDSGFIGLRRQARLNQSFPDLADRFHQALTHALSKALENLVNLAIDKNVDAILLAGDVFDTPSPPLKTLLHFKTCMARLNENNIQVCMVHGNHDYLSEDRNVIDMPPNVHVFGKQLETVSLPRKEGTIATITGISHDHRQVKENLANRFTPDPPLPADCYHIALLHCNVSGCESHEPYAPCALSDLQHLPYDYWALGHVHHRAVLSEKPHVVYPGSLQGLSMREPDAHGCYVVNMSKAQTDITFHALDAIRWQELSLDITNVTDLTAVTEMIESEIASRSGALSPKHTLICRITLTGRSALSKDLRAVSTLQDLTEHVQEGFADSKPLVWIDRINTTCRNTLNRETLAANDDLLTKVLSVSETIHDHQDPADLLADVLAPVYQHHRARKELPALSEQDYQSLVASAELLLIDLLSENEA
jgi:DNA repair exonuclease SbcCD nuclease subunit